MQERKHYYIVLQSCANVPHLVLTKSKRDGVYYSYSTLQDSRIVDGELSLMMIMQLFIKSAVKEGKNWVSKRGMLAVGRKAKEGSPLNNITTWQHQPAQKTPINNLSFFYHLISKLTHVPKASLYVSSKLFALIFLHDITNKVWQLSVLFVDQNRCITSKLW